MRANPPKQHKSIIQAPLLTHRSVHDERHRLAALPHEQRALPARARLRPGGLLRAHESLPRDLLAGLGRRAGRLDDTLPPLSQASLPLQDHLEGILSTRERCLSGWEMTSFRGSEWGAGRRYWDFDVWRLRGWGDWGFGREAKMYFVRWCGKVMVFC